MTNSSTILRYLAFPARIVTELRDLGDKQDTALYFGRRLDFPLDVILRAMRTLYFRMISLDAVDRGAIDSGITGATVSMSFLDTNLIVDFGELRRGYHQRIARAS